MGFFWSGFSQWWKWSSWLNSHRVPSLGQIWLGEDQVGRNQREACTGVCRCSGSVSQTSQKWRTGHKIHKYSNSSPSSECSEVGAEDRAEQTLTGTSGPSGVFWEKTGVAVDQLCHARVPGPPNPPFSCSLWGGQQRQCRDSVSL